MYIHRKVPSLLESLASLIGEGLFFFFFFDETSLKRLRDAQAPMKSYKKHNILRNMIPKRGKKINL